MPGGSGNDAGRRAERGGHVDRSVHAAPGLPSAAAARRGATGSSTGEDKVYRVTLRMDDGTTRVVTQDKAPTFRTGDRVNMMDGMISR